MGFLKNLLNKRAGETTIHGKTEGLQGITWENNFINGTSKKNFLGSRDWDI